jgi:hypothetical protein
MFRLQHSCRGSVKKIIKVGGENRTDWNWCKLKDRNSATQWPKREMCIKLCQFLCLPLFSDPGQHKELYLLVALTTHVILRSVGSTLVKKKHTTSSAFDFLARTSSTDSVSSPSEIKLKGDRQGRPRRRDRHLFRRILKCVQLSPYDIFHTWTRKRSPSTSQSSVSIALPPCSFVTEDRIVAFNAIHAQLSSFTLAFKVTGRV